MMWRQPRLRWSAAESKLRFSVLCLIPSVHVATAMTEMERQRNRCSLARWLGLSDDVATATTEMKRS